MNHEVHLRPYAETWRGLLRTVGTRIAQASLHVQPSQEELDAWAEHLHEVRQTFLRSGDVVHVGPARLIVRPAYRHALLEWVRSLGLVPSTTSAAGYTAASGTGDDCVDASGLYCCAGAPFHDDADTSTDVAFAIMWLSEDTGWDLVLPAPDGSGHDRVELRPGVAVVFDACRAHAVVPRGATRFDEQRFQEEHYALGFFLSVDVDLHAAATRKVLGSELRRNSLGAIVLGHPQLRVDSVTGGYSMAEARRTRMDAPAAEVAA